MDAKVTYDDSGGWVYSLYVVYRVSGMV